VKSCFSGCFLKNDDCGLCGFIIDEFHLVCET